MESNNKPIFIAVIVLLVGLGIGYYMGESRAGSFNGGHMMPNGEMMGSNTTMSMADMMTSMNAELEGKSGDVFDQAFLDEMVVHHQGAVAMAQSALTNAKHQEIKDLAAGIISAQNKEIGQMTSWRMGWYGK